MVFPHRDFSFLLAESLVPDRQGVFAAGETFDLELPLLVGHGEEGMVHDEEECLHPGVKIAAYLDRSLALLEDLLSIRGVGGLADVEGSVFFR